MRHLRRLQSRQRRQHVEACTPEFRQSVAETVGYV
jgi:hypothetical protein